ncbi:MAG: hypothetical protein KatS3mg027_2102 [Bacteroidia bacterium]|nr:MAG: hypothetical protein KatS3mg027_2102 [Bacteroidia bacterium]
MLITLKMWDEIIKKINWIEPDFFNPLDLEEIINNYQIKEIYHCAGLVSFNDKRRDELIKTNTEITANLVNVSLGKDIKFCYVSSIASLLNQFEHNHITEKTFWQPGKYEYAYALSKYLGECEVWRGIEEGLKAVIVNPGIIVGAGNWNNGWGILVKKSIQRSPFLYDWYYWLCRCRRCSKYHVSTYAKGNFRTAIYCY